MPKPLRNKEARADETRAHKTRDVEVDADDEEPAKPASKATSKPASKPAAKPRASSAPPAVAAPAPAERKPLSRPKPAFPKKVPAPTPEAFVARLPLPVGKKWESVRSFLAKQAGVSEDVHYYGPKSGWGLRYVVDGRVPLCALFLLGERPLGIVSITGEIDAQIDWGQLSATAQSARRMAHGSPALLWLDVPLDGTGAADFKVLLKSKLASVASDR